MRLLAFLQSWDLLRDELGRPPSMNEYAQRFALSPATAARDRALFDEAFPQQTPDGVLDLLWQWHEARASRGGGRRRAVPPGRRTSRP
jgi:hypothetical protein